MTQRDGMGREVEGGFRMGNTCTPMADACRCIAKSVQHYKVKNNNKKNLPAMRENQAPSGERNGNPLQYSCLENSKDRRAWQARVHGVTKSQTKLNEHKDVMFKVINFQRK